MNYSFYGGRRGPSGIDEMGINEENNLWVKYNYSNEKVILGNVKKDTGLLVGLNLNYSGDVINKLNDDYPNGLTGDNLEGKLVSVGTSDADKLFYAFDYANESWYYLGRFNMDVYVGTAEECENMRNKLPIGGVCFVIDE